MIDRIEFREASPADMDALFELKIDAFSDEFQKENYAQVSLYEEIVRKCCIQYADETNMFSHDWHKIFSTLGEHGAGDWSFVVILNEKIIGAICALPGEHSGENYAGISMKDYNVLICIYVHPDYKNKGIGKMALAYIEQKHDDRPWILDTPDVSKKNQYFYRQSGYAKKQLADGKSVFIKE